MNEVEATIDGNRVRGTHVDLGLVDALDANGEPYKAYKDRFTFGDKVVESEVDAELCKLDGNSASFRMAEALAWLENAGITELEIV